MENITLILITISVLFFILLGVKEILKRKPKKFCVICGAVVITWAILLILYFIGLFDDKIIIALLMGGSVVGIFYLWENKVKKQGLVFRLPLILIFFLLVYFVLIGKIIFESLIFLGLLWIFFLLIYLSKSNKFVGEFFKKIVECCKKW